MLKARLYEFEMQKKEEENQKELTSKTDIGWGHQIGHMFYNHISLLRISGIKRKAQIL